MAARQPISQLRIKLFRRPRVFCSLPARSPESVFDREDFIGSLARYDLGSDEFRQGIVSLVLNAYPEKQRLIAIHIPKCAGTHLRARLASRYPLVHKDLENEIRTPLPVLTEQLRALSRSIPFADAILVNGHTSLSWYRAKGLCRPQDGLFAAVRAPAEIVMSYVNHILTRFFADPRLVDPDTSLWARLLAIEPSNLDRSPEGIKRLGRRILREPLVQNRNPLCTYLGRGDFRSALWAIWRSNIEITDVTRYDSWFERKFRTPSGPRENVSTKFLKPSDLNARDFDALNALLDEDLWLYEALASALEESNAPSISGCELVRAMIAAVLRNASRRYLMPFKPSTSG